MNRPFSLVALASVLLLTSLHSFASRVVTDQIGRQVTLPDAVDRVVVLQHQTLNLLVQLNATDKIVGILANWKQQLGDGYASYAHRLTTFRALQVFSIPAPYNIVAEYAWALCQPQGMVLTDFLQSVAAQQILTQYGFYR